MTTSSCTDTYNPSETSCMPPIQSLKCPSCYKSLDKILEIAKEMKTYEWSMVEGKLEVVDSHHDDCSQTIAFACPECQFSCKRKEEFFNPQPPSRYLLEFFDGAGDLEHCCLVDKPLSNEDRTALMDALADMRVNPEWDTENIISTVETTLRDRSFMLFPFGHERIDF